MEFRTQVISVNNGCLRSGGTILNNRHNYMQLIYIYSGESIIEVNAQQYSLGKNSCVIIPSNASHMIKASKDSTLKMYEIKFFILDAYILQNVSLIPVVSIGNEFFESIIVYIVETFYCRNLKNSINIDCFMSAILTYLIRDHISIGGLDSQYILTTNYCDLVRDIIVYIEENYTKPFYLNELANCLNYSRNYICSVFKRDTGITIIDYLNFIRIRQTMAYFTYNGLDITTACVSVGFQNLSHYSRTFKKYVGVSPRQYCQGFPHIAHKNNYHEYYTNSPFSNQRIPLEMVLKSLYDIGKAIIDVV